MAKENFRCLVLSYLRLAGISDFEGNRPGNHQNSLKSRPGNNKGIKYHRWLYIIQYMIVLYIIVYTYFPMVVYKMCLDTRVLTQFRKVEL